MARSIWTGALSFGLVNIPVEVHTAVREHRPRFRMLHARDKSPIRMERVCQKDGHTVAWDDLVRGYEYAKGQFVVLTKEDLAAAALEKTRRIDILDFVAAESVDDRFFDTPYYLLPGKGGDLSYGLLAEAIRQSGRIGIAKFIMREVQHLAAVEVVDDVLVLSTLRFADELVDVGTLRVPHTVTAGKKELQMAVTLVESLASDWDPAKYTDDYRDNLMKVIKAKVKGKKAVLSADEPERDANVIDLMERLRQSLEASPKSRGSAAGARRKSPRTSARTSARPSARKRSSARGRRSAA